MRCRELAVLSVLALIAGCGGTRASGCGDLPECVQALRDHAGARAGFDGTGPDADVLKHNLLAHEDAVDALIPLLADPDERVAELAAYALRDAPRIDPDYLPQIRAGLDRGLGWLAPALARIGTDEAVREAVDRFLVSDSAPHNQEAYAVRLFGQRAIPVILERAACVPACHAKTHYLLGAVLGEMGAERAVAGPALLRLATNRQSSPEIAKGALSMIADLGVDAKPLEPALLRERESSPHHAHMVDSALVAMGSTEAGRIFAERLAGSPDVVTLRDLAEVGTPGRDAGPVVLALLGSGSELCAAAATTLGYIGYAQAMPKLIEALEDPADVTLAWAAAGALGRIGNQAALEALDDASATHWYAPVRHAAGEAATAIRSGTAMGSASPRNHFPSEFFAFQSINQGLPSCVPDDEDKPESSHTKLYYATAAGKLDALKYPAEVISYVAVDEDEQRQAGKDIVEVHAGNLVERKRAIEQTPHVALRVDDGWLVGGNRGEWGGELGFLGDDGSFQPILEVNVRDIHRLGDRIVVTTGLAHMTLNSGEVQAVQRLPGGQWQARVWRVLPGEPLNSRDTSDGLVISVNGGGAVGVAPDGRMWMSDCPR